MISVPKLGELAVVALLEEVKKDAEVSKYLPDIRSRGSISRQYLYNVNLIVMLNIFR